MLGMAEQNADLDHYISFLGAGTYDHFVPSLVPALVQRSEFLTPYTPYQPQVSHGEEETSRVKRFARSGYDV